MRNTVKFYECCTVKFILSMLNDYVELNNPRRVLVGQTHILGVKIGRVVKITIIFVYGVQNGDRYN